MSDVEPEDPRIAEAEYRRDHPDETSDECRRWDAHHENNAWGRDGA